MMVVLRGGQKEEPSQLLLLLPPRAYKFKVAVYSQSLLPFGHHLYCDGVPRACLDVLFRMTTITYRVLVVRGALLVYSG